MKIKKYLLYLLIFIVIGAIGVSIFFTLRDKNDSVIASAAQDDTNNDLEDAENKNDEVDSDQNNDISGEMIVEEVENIENYYIKIFSIFFPI